ncbi:hypothetical protein [Costertonia aggregata]|uniref:Uncharacterized protein n=1 Tax=Costertonia aggregata TaxID=343403 RepID=A0A7H9AKW1_9FLAO|nr:hypothetical protein [Costertonia aggregata]QLG43974.1 hypothetical protein HYG79_00950 [Costertonia aggregata]
MTVVRIRKVIVCSFLICSTFHLNAQPDNFKTQRTKMALYNVGVNALFGGVGSLINKKADETNFKTFINGFYKGAIGGTVSHVGLSMSHLIESKQNISYAWPARFVNAIGSSIVQNAAENNRMFERLHFNLYAARLEYFPYQKRFNARLFTSSIYGIAVVGSGSRFDLNTSLKSGVLFFESDGRFENALGSGRATGQVSSIGMQSDIQGDLFYKVFAEEVAHIQQYDRKVGGNAFAVKLDANWKRNSKFYKNTSKYIYFDLNGPLFFIAYAIEEGGKCNFFEQEAVNYANRIVNPCN